MTSDESNLVTGSSDDKIYVHSEWKLLPTLRNPQNNVEGID